MKITFIGGGNMATALIGGLLKKSGARNNISVVEIEPQARERIARELGVRAHADITAVTKDVDCIVLAVKPQQLRGVAERLGPLVRHALIVSIAAGIRVRDLSRWLGGHSRIVRAMPNTPALVLTGMTGLYAAPGVNQGDRDTAQSILSAAGSTLWVEDEAHIDGITAISGSGPAYVFYFIEALQQAALELGFDANAARTLAQETFAGAIKLAQESDDNIATLRARVTSKGGTTECALSRLEKDDVRQAIVRAAHAAATRSRELGDELGQDDSQPLRDR
ncbi:MAG: pyrroline-5-carboxylate reductase [Pseudomonadota bacterium]